MISPALIHRLEQANHATDELNADVWLTTRVGWSQRAYHHWAHMLPKGSADNTERHYALERAPNFCGSLDAAMSLGRTTAERLDMLREALKRCEARFEDPTIHAARYAVIASLKALQQKDT